MPKTAFENIYKFTIRNLKISIDFDEIICYYIFKERETRGQAERSVREYLPKSSKGVQSNGNLNFQHAKTLHNISEVQVAEKEYSPMGR